MKNVGSIVRRVTTIILALVSGAYIVLKLIADWIGRSTFFEDLASAQEKISALLSWLSSQPILIFYQIPIGLIITALLLTFHPEISLLIKKLLHINPTVADIRKMQPSDYAAWDIVNELSLWQTMFLWSDLVPTGHMDRIPDVARPRNQFLREAIRNGDIKAYRLKNGNRTPVSEPDWSDLLVRDELKNFASKKGQKPKFLFLDARSSRI